MIHPGSEMSRMVINPGSDWATLKILLTIMAAVPRSPLIHGDIVC